MVKNDKVCMACRKIAHEPVFRKFKKDKSLGEIRIHVRIILKWILTDLKIKGTSYTIMLFDIN